LNISLFEMILIWAWREIDFCVKRKREISDYKNIFVERFYHKAIGYF